MRCPFLSKRFSMLFAFLGFALALSWLYASYSSQNRDLIPDVLKKKPKFASRQGACSCSSAARINPQNPDAWGDPERNKSKDVVSPCGSRYGKAVLDDDITVVYNRVQKCGSRALIQSVRSVVKGNKIHGPVSLVPPSFQDELPLLRRTVEGVKNESRAFIEGHVRFNLFDEKRVYYINMIRDPLQRLVSSYYFNRYGDGFLSPQQLEELRKLTKPEVIDESFDDCIRNMRLSCTGPKVLSHVIGFFCGYHPQCRKPTQWTLEEAKRNLDHYTVVGIVEEYNSSLRAIEFMFPNMFKNLVKKFTKINTETNFQFKAHAHRRVPPSPKIAKYMEEKLKLEYEFYEYAKARFHRLLDQLHLKDGHSAR